MTPRVEIALWSIAIVIAAFLLARPSQVGFDAVEPVVVRRPFAASRPDEPPNLGPLAHVIVAGNLFRNVREPAPLRAHLIRVSEVPSPQQALPGAMPTPLPRLRGIVGGPPWEALIEGLPGRSEPILVRANDRSESAVIRSVTRDSVVLEVNGQILRLGLARAWQ